MLTPSPAPWFLSRAHTPFAELQVLRATGSYLLLMPSVLSRIWREIRDSSHGVCH